jgi:hypothetical protein
MNVPPLNQSRYLPFWSVPCVGKERSGWQNPTTFTFSLTTTSPTLAARHDESASKWPPTEDQNTRSRIENTLVACHLSSDGVMEVRTWSPRQNPFASSANTPSPARAAARGRDPDPDYGAVLPCAGMSEKVDQPRTSTRGWRTVERQGRKGIARRD